AASLGADTRVPGQQRRWALTFDISLDQAVPQQPLRMALTGEWVATVSAVRDGEYDQAYEVANARVAGVGPVDVAVADVDARRPRLAPRFWASYRQDGAPLRVHFSNDVDPSHRTLLQMLATETQLVRPEGAGAQWTALERDGAGLYLAIYQWTGPERIVKR